MNFRKKKALFLLPIIFLMGFSNLDNSQKRENPPSDNEAVSDRPKYVLDCFADYDLADFPGRAFTTNYEKAYQYRKTYEYKDSLGNSLGGIMYEDDELEKLNNQGAVIEGKKWKIPRDSEWASIFPSKRGMDYRILHDINEPKGREIDEENISSPIINNGKLSNYKAIYKTSKVSPRMWEKTNWEFTLCGLRYISTDNAHLSAWRYRYKRSLMADSITIRLEINIDEIFLGSKGNSKDITPLLKESYWKKTDATKRFVLYYHRNPRFSYNKNRSYLSHNYNMFSDSYEVGVCSMSEDWVPYFGGSGIKLGSRIRLIRML